MLRRLLCIVGIILIFSDRSDAQATMDSYTKKLFFNLFTAEPDTSIRGFLKLYVPVLYNNPMPGKWTSYAPADTSRTHEEMHAFFFKKHPFLTGKFENGHLDISCKRYEGTQIMQNITGIRLWFEFDTIEDAELVFSRLVDMFILVSTNKRINTINGAPRAAFVNTDDKTGFTKVQVVMVADNIGVHKYKVLFEAGNEL